VHSLSPCQLHSFFSWSGVILSPLGTSATHWPIVPAPDGDECGAVGEMRIGRGNRNAVNLLPGRRDGKPATNRLSYL
jgi:hypothetical protein